MEIPFLLVLSLIALVLLSLEAVPVDLVAVGLLVALMGSEILTPTEALAGFGSEAVLVLAGLFVLAAGLKATGAVDELGHRLGRSFFEGRSRGTLLLLLIVTAASAFMNNTTCTALFLPLGLTIARRSRDAPSRVLMPLAFASILGGTLTVIGTSTNVIVRGLMPSYGLEPLTMFEMLPVALPTAVLGVVYLTLARKLLPPRAAGTAEERYAVRSYLTEVTINDKSPLAGRTVAESELGRQFNLNLLGIVRGGQAEVPAPDTLLAEGDVLVVEGDVETLTSLGPSRGLSIRPAVEHGADALHVRDVQLIEAVILPRSDLVGRNLREANFRQRFSANVIALNRHGEVVVEKLGRIRFRVGDMLLIQAQRGAAERLAAQNGLLVLGRRKAVQRSPRAALLAAGIFLGVVFLNASGLVGLALSVLLGCLILVLSRCLTAQEAYSSIDWRLLVLVAGMMAFGTALTKTGAAALLATTFADLSSGFGPIGILAALYILTVALTQPMSNQAAALVVLPVALQVAATSGLDPRAVVVTVTLAASSSFLTPLEPSCLLVYGPGGYRFFDYPRLGLGLTLLAFIVTLLLVPVFWPL